MMLATRDALAGAVPAAEGTVWPDWDAAQAKQTRRAVLERYADTDILVCTAHFPLPSAGRIIAEGDAFRFLTEADW